MVNTDLLIGGIIGIVGFAVGSGLGVVILVLYDKWFGSRL